MKVINYISDSTIGTSRKINKDFVFILENDAYLLTILFDGVSSAEQAILGINVATEYVRKNSETFFVGHDFKLAEMMFNANEKIVESGLSTPYTTYSAVCILKSENLNTFIWSNLGDSRIYKVNPQYIRQLSVDDNLIHSKNIVTRCLGMVQLSKEDFIDQRELFDTKVLLCSDGFYSIMDTDLLKFSELFNFKLLSNTKKSLGSRVETNNHDDASYILIEKNV